MRTPAARAAVEGLRAHPLFLGPEDSCARPRAGNLVVGVAVPLLTVGGDVLRGTASSSTLVAGLIAVVVGCALVWSARWPYAALGLALAGAVLVEGFGEVNGPIIGASLIAVYTVASRRPRVPSAVASAVSALVLLGIARADLVGPVLEPRALILVVWSFLAFALGDGVRTQRAYVAAMAERARRAELTREHEARARVAEERVRIARELHDVVAHHIAVINVHAGLARRALGRDERIVDSSLEHVQGAAHTVLAELGSVLRVLRSTDGEPLATEPAPGLALLPDLLETFATAGLAVRARTSGRLRALDGTCDLAAFRIVQESLTNASKHGTGGRAELELRYTDDVLTIDVRNPAAGRDTPTSPEGYGGQGVLGMRERAEACGGSFVDRRETDGTYRVTAVVPYRPPTVTVGDGAARAGASGDAWRASPSPAVRP